MKKNILNKKKLKFLNCAIKHVPFEGWNDGIFSTIAKDFKIKTQDVSSLFSGKYLELLKFYLEKNAARSNGTIITKDIMAEGLNNQYNSPTQNKIIHKSLLRKIIILPN